MNLNKGYFSYLSFAFLLETLNLNSGHLTPYWKIFFSKLLPMLLEGTHVLAASREKIWELLMDPDTLAKVTPGITRLDPISEDSYKAIAEVKIGPVSGSFSGDMEVLDKVSPESFTLKMKQNSKIGNVQAKGSILLKSIDEGTTEVEFSGKAQLSGLLARTGQRVLSGVARSLTDQFFKAIEEELENAS